MSEIPEFVKPGAVVRVTYEIEVESVRNGRIRYAAADVPYRHVNLNSTPPPILQLVKPAPEPACATEPTNLGAIARIDGKTYTRILADPVAEWRAAWVDLSGGLHSWASMTSNPRFVVEILSRGLDPEDVPAPPTPEPPAGTSVRVTFGAVAPKHLAGRPAVVTKPREREFWRGVVFDDEGIGERVSVTWQEITELCGEGGIEYATFSRDSPSP